MANYKGLVINYRELGYRTRRALLNVTHTQNRVGRGAEKGLAVLKGVVGEGGPTKCF